MTTVSAYVMRLSHRLANVASSLQRQPTSPFHTHNPPPPAMNAPPLPPPPPALVRPSASSIFSSVSEQLPFNSPRTTFRHPGYPDSDNVLFSLSPIDNGGVHHGTALSACIIFACNVKGYLAASRDAADGDRAYDEILTAPNYYYYPSTPSQAARYPVCPSFEHWVFPADPLSVIPPSWQEAVVRTPSLSLGPTR